MTTTTAARVEVLTAEVRVLMVGSRQVTLSVYAQLDRVEPEEIEPFGRVRPRDAEYGHIYVVGASTRPIDQGTLARSSGETSTKLLETAQRLRQQVAAAGAKNRWLAAHGEMRDRRQHGQLATPEEERHLRELRDEKEKLLRSPGIYEPDLDQINAARARAMLETAGTLEAEAEDARLWEALPLIVLAGLR